MRVWVIPSDGEWVCPKNYQSNQSLKCFDFSKTFLSFHDLKRFRLANLLIFCKCRFVISRKPCCRDGQGSQFFGEFSLDLTLLGLCSFKFLHCFLLASWIYSATRWGIQKGIHQNRKGERSRICSKIVKFIVYIVNFIAFAVNRRGKRCENVRFRGHIFFEWHLIV